MLYKLLIGKRQKVVPVLIFVLQILYKLMLLDFATLKYIMAKSDL